MINFVLGVLCSAVVFIIFPALAVKLGGQLRGAWDRIKAQRSGR